MDPSPTRSPRRSDALSRERIVTAAVELLDSVGEAGLTLRGLTAYLSTGRGALYHHVTSREELLAAATDDLVGRALADVATDDDATATLRALARAVFDTIDAHPWVGTQLAREPLQPAVLRLWTSLGSQLHRVGLTGSARSDAGSTLVAYVLGSAAQHAAGATTRHDPAARQAYLDRLAAVWAAQDADPVVQESAAELRTHDDRAQFLAGLDIVLAGVAAR